MFQNLKKAIKEVKPKIWIAVGLVVVVIAGATISGVWYFVAKNKKASTNNSNADTKKVVVLDKNEIEKAKDQASVSGKIKTITAASLTVVSGASEITLGVNEGTRITKGPSIEAVPFASLKVGMVVTANYSVSTKVISNVWYEK